MTSWLCDWHCVQDHQTWPGCGFCGPCEIAAPDVFNSARTLLAMHIVHQQQHGEAIARLDAQREELRGLLADRNRLAREMADVYDERDTAREEIRTALDARAEMATERDDMAGVLATALAEIDRLRTGIDTAVLEIDYEMESNDE